jgi:hypothetical protein
MASYKSLLEKLAGFASQQSASSVFRSNASYSLSSYVSKCQHQVT